MKPIPTEYMGTRYKSKSEAQFACWLDNALTTNAWTSAFVYEPRWLMVGEWTPDFASVGTCFRQFAIEYKPSRPTPAYIENLEVRFETLWQDHRCNCFCLWGTIFRGNDTRGALMYIPKDLCPERWIEDDQWHSLLPWETGVHEYDDDKASIVAKWDQAMINHRYDLL